jgi:hypothetical protein
LETAPSASERETAALRLRSVLEAHPEVAGQLGL